MSVTRAAVNTSTASGGVSAPMHRFATMTTPKCTRSMFAAFRSGTSSGTRITIEAIISMASPTNSRNTLSTSSSRIQLPVRVAMPAASFCGTCSMISANANGADAAITTSTVAVSATLSRSACSSVAPFATR